MSIANGAHPQIMIQAIAHFIAWIVWSKDIQQANAPCGTRRKIRKHGAPFAMFTDMKHIRNTAGSTNHCTHDIATYAKILDIGRHTHVNSARRTNHHRPNQID